MKKSLRLLSLALVMVMLCLTFSSCGGPNANPDKALAALKENGITWAAKDSYAIPTALSLAGVSDIDCVVTGTGKIDDKYAHITIVYFDEAEDAKDAYEKVEDFAETYKKEAENSEWVVKQSGKMVYFGTKDAVKAAK